MLRKIKIFCGVLVMAAAALCIIFWAENRSNQKDKEGPVRIHFIGLHASTDAILLEDNGHFALVDSGEDWDYPQGNHLEYPYRSGVIINQGFEQQVIYYMKSVGVTEDNLDFYIGTHSHSDHIGTADEIIRTFRPKIIYLKRYSDGNVTSRDNWWDNLYVYRMLLAQAEKEEVPVEQNLPEGMELTLGKHTRLQLYNTRVISGVKDENANSLVILGKLWNNTVLLTGDMEPKTARTLLKKKFIGQVDILKLPHHGYLSNNPADILKKFSPKTAVVTGPLSNLDEETSELFRKMQTDLRTVHLSGAALVCEFFAQGYTASASQVQEGWFDWENNRYFVDKDGQPYTGEVWIQGEKYIFDERGRLQK